MGLTEFCRMVEEGDSSWWDGTVVSTKTYLEAGGRHRFVVCEVHMRGRTRWVRLDRRGNPGVSLFRLWYTGTVANDEVRYSV